ncbi:MAG: hypothetical protein R3260_05890 [Pseudomonas sp.]|nr:hypothetical protein [Pseudomonas sp.]
MCRYIISLLGVLVSTPLYAEQHAAQALRVIPKTYISAGANGSIGSSQQAENYNLYGGQRLPSGLRREGQGYSSQSFEQRGTLKQSTEYPAGHRTQQYSGQGTAYHERSR